MSASLTVGKAYLASDLSGVMDVRESINGALR